MITEKLYENIKSKSVVCVGLDTDINYIPEEFSGKFENKCDAVLEYNKRIIDSTYDIAACYKVQIAYYESMGIKGMKVYSDTLKYIKSKNLVAISDIKRGDIGATAEKYAKAHFSGDFETDMITVNPYMGTDTLKPYYPYLESKGIFVLVRTSNPGSGDFQLLKTENGKLYSEIAEKIKSEGMKYTDKNGISQIGMVIGCTHKEEAEKIRYENSGSLFLIPGYGAQGGEAETVKILLGKNRLGVVNSSRAILTAYKKFKTDEFDTAARKEVNEMKEKFI